MKSLPRSEQPARFQLETLCGELVWRFCHHLNSRTYLAGVVRADGTATIGRYGYLHSRMTFLEESLGRVIRLDTTGEYSEAGIRALHQLATQLQGC